ncbi:MAG: glycerol-3-phosphate acyltransferase [Bacillota bacterium]
MTYAALLLLAAYLIGSIPFPVIVSRLVRGVDLRQHGSGNMGALNAGRVLGKRWFPVVMLLDLSKGLVATYMALRLLPGFVGVTPLTAAALGGFLVVAGHCFPVFAGFRGGVGLAATGGALLVISPALFAVAGGTILAGWALSRNMHVGVAIAALLYPAMGWLLLRDGGAVGAMTAWGLMVCLLHYRDVKAWWMERRI